MPFALTRVTVITACRNARTTIGETIESVLQQTYPAVEYVVIDGGSTDGTLDVIRKHSARMSYWISEQDNGIAEAWNKGLAHSHGQIIGILNADDVYDAHAIEMVVAGLRPDERVLSYGTARFFSTSTQDVQLESKVAFRLSEVCDGFGFMHPTCFTTRRVYDEVGRFDTRYRLAMDTDFLLRCLRSGVEFRRLANVTYMRAGGLSERHMTAARLEYYRQLWRHGFPAGRIAVAAARFVRWRVRCRLAQLARGWDGHRARGAR